MRKLKSREAEHVRDCALPERIYGGAPLSLGAHSKTPLVPESMDRTEPIYSVWPPTHISMIKFNLLIKHSKRLTTVTNNKIEQLKQLL